MRLGDVIPNQDISYPGRNAEKIGSRQIERISDRYERQRAHAHRDGGQPDMAVFDGQKNNQPKQNAKD